MDPSHSTSAASSNRSMRNWPGSCDPRERRGPGLQLFVGQAVDGGVSCDSPRFLSFIPAAPTKASLLFDCSSRARRCTGTSWPRGGRRRRGREPGPRWCSLRKPACPRTGGLLRGGFQRQPPALKMVAADTRGTSARRTHAATARRAEQDAHVVQSRSESARFFSKTGLGATEDHRLTGTAPRRRPARDPAARARRHRSCRPRRETRCRHRRTTWRGSPSVAAEPLPLVPRRWRLRRSSRLFATSVRDQFAGFRKGRLRSSWIPHKMAFAPSTRRFSSRQPNLPSVPHPGSQYSSAPQRKPEE